VAERPRGAAGRADASAARTIGSVGRERGLAGPVAAPGPTVSGGDVATVDAADNRRSSD